MAAETPFKVYVHPRSQEWAEGYIEARGWNAVVVSDSEMKERTLLFESRPWPNSGLTAPVVEHLRPITDLRRSPAQTESAPTALPWRVAGGAIYDAEDNIVGQGAIKAADNARIVEAVNLLAEAARFIAAYEDGREPPRLSSEWREYLARAERESRAT